jgi:hypothetical protein
METEKQAGMKRRYGPAAFFGLFILGGSGLTGVFNLFGVTVADSLLFAAGLFIGVYIPGLVLCRWLKVKAGRFETTTLALALGMTATTLVYRVCGFLGARGAFLVWLGGSIVLFVAGLAKRPPRKEDFSFSLTAAGVGFGLLVLVVIGTQFIDNYRNGIRQPDGSVRLNMHYYDGFTRNALVRELSHSIPPQLPFAAGLSVNYHYDMNLFASIFYRHLGLGVLDLLHRFTLTFYFAVFLMTAFIFFRRWSGSAGVGLLGTVLVLFGNGGFAYVFGLTTPYPGFWGKMFYSMYYLDLVSINPILPALALLFAGLYSFLAYLEKRRTGWLIVSAYFLALITGYKMTIVLPLLAALGAAAALYLLVRNEKAPLRLFLTTSLLSAPFILLSSILVGNAPKYLVQIRFSDWIVFPFLEAKLLALASSWGNLIRGSTLTAQDLGVAILAVVLFIAGAFGPSLMSLPSLIKDLFVLSKDRILEVVLALLFFAAVVMFFFVNPTLGARSRNWIMVDLLKLSALILIVIWTARIGMFARKTKGALAAGTVLAAIALSVPNVAQFIAVKHRVPDPMIVEAAFMDACAYLNNQTAPESVILHSARVLFVCYFADRRVVLDSSFYSYPHFHLTQEQFEERTADIKRFYADPAGAGDVLAKYGVSYVWVKRQTDAKIWTGSLAERIACPPLSLDLVYRNNRYALFKVNGGIRLGFSRRPRAGGHPR